MPGRVRSLLAELRRRNVFKVTAVYAATAFVIWQATEIAFPRLGLPDWSVTLVVLLSLVGLPVAVVLAWAYELTPAGVARTAREEVQESLPEGRDREGLPAQNSVAVLPLRTLGSDPEGEFFAEGMTEDIISYLARIRGLRVISRTSSMRFRDSELDVARIAAELGVRHILEGSVRRQEGSLRVSTNLIDARTDQHLWAETFDRPWADVFAVQSEIAENVAEALDVNLSHGERSALSQAPTEDLEAYGWVLEGRRKYDRFLVPESIALYTEATKRDPEYADAFAALAQATTYMGQGYWGIRPRDVIPDAIEAAERALRLSPEHAEAMATLGFIEYVHNLDIEKGCMLLRDAIALGQSSAVPHFNYAAVMWMMGRYEESLESFDRAIQYDPLNFNHHLNYAQALHFAGRDEEVVEKLTRSREVFGPGFLGLYQGLALVELGRGVEALPYFRELVEADPGWGFGQQLLAYGLVCAGQADEGMAVIDDLEDRENEEYLLPLGFSFAYTAVGDDETALRRLEQSFDDRAGLPLMGSPAFRPLRADQRYRSILVRMGVEA